MDDQTLNRHDLVLTAFICVNEDVTVIVGKYQGKYCRDVNILVSGSDGMVVVTVEEVDELVFTRSALRSTKRVQSVKWRTDAEKIWQEL